MYLDNIELFLIIFVFYVFIPGAGAFLVRAQWRGFRSRCIEISLRPYLRLSHLTFSRDSTQEEDHALGIFRFCGELDAVGNDGKLWIKGEGLTVKLAVDAEELIYYLPDHRMEGKENFIEKNKKIFSDEIPRIIKYKHVISLPIGTRIYLCGELFWEGSSLVFRSVKDSPLFFLVFKGRTTTLLRRAIWSGRQRNEYWNSFTAPSLIAGVFSLVLLAYSQATRSIGIEITIFTVLCALIPVLAFLPPGIVFYYLYRRFWIAGRTLRAERDLIRLPLRFFPKKQITDNFFVALPDGTCYGVKKINSDEMRSALHEGARIRSCFFDRQRFNRNEAFLFGQIEAGGAGHITKPDDPITEYVMTFGQPVQISTRLEKRAARLEVLSICFFSSALVCNFILGLLIALMIFS